MGTAEPLVTLPDDLPPDVEVWLDPCLTADERAATEGKQPAIDPLLAPRIARRRARVEAQRAERRAAVDAEIDRLRLWQQVEDARNAREAVRRSGEAPLPTHRSFLLLVRLLEGEIRTRATLRAWGLVGAGRGAL